jgi:hydrogenase small subunit
MLSEVKLNPLVTSTRVLNTLGTIDERLTRCGISRRAFPQFFSSLMIAAPFGLAISGKKTPEEAAAGLGKVIRPAVIWLPDRKTGGRSNRPLRPKLFRRSS